MQLKGLVPVIYCQHIEQTLEFYQQAFRYIVLRKTETEEGLQWAYLKSDNTYLMLQKLQQLDANRVDSGNILLHYYTSDITVLHQFITARGIQAGPIEITDYGMSQFYVTDPEGNRISIGQNERTE